MASAGDSSADSGAGAPDVVEAPAPKASTKKKAAPPPLMLTGREWAVHADAFGVSPQAVMGALGSDEHYTRDAAKERVDAFMTAPAEKE